METKLATNKKTSGGKTADGKRVLQLLFLLAVGILFSFNKTTAQNNLNIYGYFSSEYEKAWQHPRLSEDGLIEREYEPGSFNLHSLNLIMQYSVNDNFRFYLNLNGQTESAVSVSNVWGEYSASQYLNIRFGRTYRKFGLYNEILDAAPTYFGIDSPEHIDESHPLLSRTTDLMVYGSVDLGNGLLDYSLSTDNGQGIDDSFEKSKPLGWDLKYIWGSGDYTIGTSGYTSFGDVHSNVEFGEGFPTNGVFPWMEKDKFSVFSGYVETKFGNLTLQAEYINAPHKGVRNPEKVIEIVENATINNVQRARFLINPAEDATFDNINTIANYSINAWYLRAAYSFETPIGEITPYGWVDYYKNPENIDDEYFGGDGEVGDTDTGVMGSYTIGICYRPVPSVAIKFENENHWANFVSAGKVYSSDLRINVSYIFGQ